jgi:hypothetical protein
VNRKQSILLDFEVDKLTNSTENVVTGDSFRTQVILLTKEDIKGITKKNGWLFDWKYEFKQPDRDVYKLTIEENQRVIQGLVSLSVEVDHVYMPLIESAAFNRGRNKIYAGVPGNLVAFASKLSFQKGCDRYVSFTAKTKLIDHYIKTLGAVHFGGHRMIINREASLKLIDKYFKDN